MKKILALLLTVIAVVCLCSCGNNSYDSSDSQQSPVNNYTGYAESQQQFTENSYDNSKNSKQPLTAKNFTTLMDSNYFLYAFWRGSPCVLFFENGGVSEFQGARLDSSLNIDYAGLSSGLGSELKVYDYSHFAIREAYGSTHYSLVYSDPNGDYVVFADDEYKEGQSLFYSQLTCMNIELMKSVWNKLLADDSFADMDSGTFDDWIKFIDSCK